MIGAAIAARCLAIRGGRHTHVRAALLVALTALSALVVSAAAAPNYPELTGRVTDEAGLLTASGLLRHVVSVSQPHPRAVLDEVRVLEDKRIQIPPAQSE